MQISEHHEPVNRWRRAVLLAGLFVGTSGFSGSCNIPRVVVPAPEQDTIPVITFTILPIGGTGDATPSEVKSSSGPTATVKVGGNGKCSVPQMMIVASATCPIPGAVRDLSLSITSGGNPVYPTVNVSQSPDLQNMVNQTVSILGANGLNGAVLELDFGSGKAGCPQNKSFHVSAKSSDFHDKAATLDVDIAATTLSAAGCICE